MLVLLREAIRRNDQRDVAPDRLRRRVAEHPLGGVIPALDGPIQRLADDGVAGRFHDRRQLAGVQKLFRLLVRIASLRRHRHRQPVAPHPRGAHRLADSDDEAARQEIREHPHHVCNGAKRDEGVARRDEEVRERDVADDGDDAGGTPAGRPDGSGDRAEGGHERQRVAQPADRATSGRAQPRRARPSPERWPLMRVRMDSLFCKVGPIVWKAPQRGRDETRPFTVLALAGGSALRRDLHGLDPQPHVVDLPDPIVQQRRPRERGDPIQESCPPGLGDRVQPRGRERR